MVRTISMLLVLWGLALAQTYAVGRILSLGEGRATVALEGQRVEAELPQGDGGFRVGQRVVVFSEGGRHYVTEPDRWGWLLGLFALFLLMAVGLGRGQGVKGVLGTLLGFLVLVYLVVPRMAAGGEPLLWAGLGSLGVLLLSIYFVHGVNRKTTAALMGTVFSVLLTLFLARFLVQALGFTGLASEEALLLRQRGGVDLLSLWLAGVVVGALGALTDVAVTQAAVVQALAHANPRLGLWELYARAMRVGYDHIGSLINTLVFAYASGSLPLFLLLTQDPTPVRFLLNTEPFAAEVVSMLLGSMGLILAVPFTTLLAAFLFQGGKGGFGDGHAHTH
ncbi:MAG: YibE/F family protein [Thermaceae bacterium]